MQVLKTNTNANIVILSRYDLLEYALHHTLQKAGFTSIRTHLVDSYERPSLIILDDTCFHPDGLPIIRQQHPITPILIIDNQCQPHHIVQAQQHDVSGYLYLGDRLVDRLPQAVIDILEGGTYYSPHAATLLAETINVSTHVLPKLNPYHHEVLHYMALHWNPDQIASQLGRTRHAIYQVQGYMRSLFGVENNNMLLDYAAKWRIIEG